MEFIRAQRTRIPRITPADLSNYTVLITGSNTGLGLEAAREFLKSRPCRLILAVRNMEKGKVAKAELEKTTKGQTKIEVRKLDQGSFESVRYFVNDLRGERVDFALLNAGSWNTQFVRSADGIESDIQVNVLSPALLSLLLLPNLRSAKSSASALNPCPHLTFVSSALHEMAKFSERKNKPGAIISALNESNQYNQQDRYQTGKTIGLLWARELAQRVPSSDVIINSANPGFCKTEIMQNMHGFMSYLVNVFELLFRRPAADGARCLVDAALVKREETHGKYLSEAKIKPESELVRSSEGRELQGRLWEEITVMLKSNGLDQASIP